MILRLQLLVIFTFSLFLTACTEDRAFNVDNKTVDISLDNAEEITLGVIQSTFLTHLYLPIFDFLGERDLPNGAVKVENITVPQLVAGEVFSCQDLIVRDSDDSGAALYCYDSPYGGAALYSFPAEQRYLAGDRVTVQYEDYVNELGWVQNGRLAASYLSKEGLNRDLGEAESVSCLVNLQSDLNGRTKIKEQNLLVALLGVSAGVTVGDVVIDDIALAEVLPSRDSGMLVSDVRLNSQELNSVFLHYQLNGSVLNGVKLYDVVADTVSFISFADELQAVITGRVQVFDDVGNPVLENGLPTFVKITDEFGTPILDSNDQIQYVQETLETFVIGKDEKVIVVNHSSDTTENQIASIDHDQIYSVSTLNWEEALCHGYERELSASLEDFSVEKDGIQYEIDGSVRIVEGTADNISFTHDVRKSSFTTTVTQEKSVEVYKMSDFSIAYAQGTKFGSFAFDSVLDGNISSTVFPGTLTVYQGQPIIGHDGRDRPTTGQFSMFGQNLELIFATFRDFTVFMAVDYNGDSTGNDRSDVDFRFEPNWDDLMNRDFIRPDEP